MNIFKDIIDYLTKLFTWWVVVMPWEQGIRITWGKKATVLNGGVFLKLPLIHQVYIQEKRKRVIVTPIQTLSTADGHVITMSCAVTYSIVDIYKLYSTLYQPDMTISSLLLGEISSYICTNNLADCAISKLESALNSRMKSSDYGLEFDHVKVVNFASVKTFRLIQDSTQLWEGLDLKLKA